MFKKAFLLDLLERSIWTFVQTFLGLLLADTTELVPVTIDASEKLQVAGIAGLIAVGKGILASRVGDSNTAQALPGNSTTYVNKP